jgi:metallo-beta-lactamase family protein
VLFVGYQAEGSLGRQIVDGQKTVRIFGDEIAVKAEIRSIESYSAHADQAGLMEWVKKFSKPPREIFIVHGEPESSAALAGLLRAEPGMKATVPALQQIFELLPEGVKAAPEDRIRTLYDSVTAKLRELMASDIEASRREEILRGLAELENIINKAK